MGIKQVVDYYEHNGQTYQETRYIEIPMFKVYYQVDEQTAKQFDLSASDLTGRVGNEFETVEEAFEFIAKLNSTPGAMGFHPFYRQAHMWVTDENGNIQFKDLTAKRVIFTLASAEHDFLSSHVILNDAGCMRNFLVRGEQPVRLVVARDDLAAKQLEKYESVSFARFADEKDLLNKVTQGTFVPSYRCMAWLRKNELYDIADEFEEELGPKYTIEINQDPHIDPVNDYDGVWTPYSFSREFKNYRDPNDFFIDGDPSKPQLWLRNKLRVGLAFYMSYYEHGLCRWSLAGEGSSCPWDSVGLAGVLVWEEPPSNMGAKTKEDRAKDARNFLEEYTEWCNGNCYWYTIKDRDGTTIDSCAGFVGNDQLEDGLREALPEDATEENTEFTGEISFHYLDIFPKKDNK